MAAYLVAREGSLDSVNRKLARREVLKPALEAAGFQVSHSEAGLYLQTVAALAGVLRDDAVVDRLVEARSPTAVLEVPEVRAITIQPRLTVRDVMTQRVYRVGPDSTVREVLDLISEHKLSAIPVVDDDRVVLGMVSDRDLMRFLLPRMQKSAEIPAGLREVTVREFARRYHVDASQARRVSSTRDCSSCGSSR